MITYKAAYKFLVDGVHAEVLDFPGTVTCGKNLDEARELLSAALLVMAGTTIHSNNPLPDPDPNSTDPAADLVEPIELVLTDLPNTEHRTSCFIINEAADDQTNA